MKAANAMSPERRQKHLERAAFTQEAEDLWDNLRSKPLGEQPKIIQRAIGAILRRLNRALSNLASEA